MMPVALSALKPGDVVYSVSTERAGNTTLRRTVCRTVTIKEVDAEKGTVLASWNGNTAKTFRACGGKLPWRRSKPAPSRY